MPRYALYFVPDPAGALFRFGSSVIGYDSAAGVRVPFSQAPPCDAPDWEALTADPRTYGFHATLRAPFEPVADADIGTMTVAARTLAGSVRAFTVPALTVARMGRFVALVPPAPAPALMALAAACVRAFEPFRAPLAASDRARRLAAPLTPAQIANLDAWGYPYVFDEFRFHMTLTGKLPADHADAIRDALAAGYAAIDAPVAIDAVALLEQPDRASPFRLVDRFALAAG